MTFTTRSLRSLATAALLGAAAVIVPGQGAHAADQPFPGAASPVPPAALRDWSLTITPYLWASSLKGDAVIKGFRAPVDVPFSEMMKELQFGAMGAADLRIGRFGGYINGEYGKIASDRHVARLTLGVGTENYLVSGGVYYRIYEAALGGNTVFGRPRVLAIEPTAGLRWTDMKTTARVGGFRLSNRENWLDPFFGARLSYDLNDRLNFALEADVGGFGAGSRLSLNGQAALGYRTTLLGVPTTLKAGYRILHQDYRDGGFKWKVTQHGPIAGASMEF